MNITARQCTSKHHHHCEQNYPNFIDALFEFEGGFHGEAHCQHREGSSNWVHMGNQVGIIGEFVVAGDVIIDHCPSVDGTDDKMEEESTNHPQNSTTIKPKITFTVKAGLAGNIRSLSFWELF